MDAPTQVETRLLFHGEDDPRDGCDDVEHEDGGENLVLMRHLWIKLDGKEYLSAFNG